MIVLISAVSTLGSALWPISRLLTLFHVITAPETLQGSRNIQAFALIRAVLIAYNQPLDISIAIYRESDKTIDEKIN